MENKQERQMTEALGAISDMRSGKVLADINEKFNNVIAAVIDVGKEGELSIKIKIKPSKFGLGGVVLEVDTIYDAKVKLPELEIGNSTFFVTQDGRLTRNDPAQEAMFSDTTEVVNHG